MADEEKPTTQSIEDMFGADDSDSEPDVDVKSEPSKTVSADASGLFGSDSESEDEEPPTKRLKSGSVKKSSKKKSGSQEKAVKEGDEYDSGEEVSRTKDDDDFIADDDDNAELLAEYNQDSQHFNDERPMGEEELEEKPMKDSNFFDETMASMRSGRRRRGKIALSPQELERLAQEVLYRMDKAWEDDQTAIREGKPGIYKIQLLDTAVSIFSKVQFQQTLLDYDLLGIIKKWIQPSDDGKLPNLGIRTKLLNVVQRLPVLKDHLKRSGFGKAIMALWKHPNELPENKEICRALIERWSRSVFQKSLDYRKLAELEAEKMEMGAYRRKRAQRSPSPDGADNAIGADGNAVDRVRIPRSMKCDFHVRPTPRIDAGTRRSTKLEPSSKKGKLTKRMQNIARPARKNIRTVKMSIEGRD